MSADPTGTIQEWIERLNALATLPVQLAPKVAAELDKQIRANVAAGVDPDGKAWPATRDGKQPLRNAGKALTVRALGTRIVATLTGPEALHHLGRARGGVVRRILPSAKLPGAVVAAIKRVIASELDKVLHG